MYRSNGKHKMLDDNKWSFWHSNRAGSWVKIDSPTSQLLKKVKIWRRQGQGSFRYYQVCLHVNDESIAQSCTRDKYGNPLNSGYVITFPMKTPRFVNKEQTIMYFSLPVVLIQYSRITLLKSLKRLDAS